MKAVAYYEMFKNSTDRDQCIVEIGKSFLNEIIEISKARNVKLDTGLIPIVKDQNNKWIKFAELVNSNIYPVQRPIKSNGFLGLLKEASPELYNLYTK